MISGVAERYARSLFDLALEEKALPAVEKDLAEVETLLSESADLRRLIGSPVFSADDQYRAIAAIADAAGIKGLVGNFLRVAALNRRLFAVPAMIRGFRALAAAHRGEVAADVTSAHALSDVAEGGTRSDAQGRRRQGCLGQSDGRSQPFSAG